MAVRLSGELWAPAQPHGPCPTKSPAWTARYWLTGAGRTSRWELEAGQRQSGQSGALAVPPTLPFTRVFPAQALSVLLLPRNIPPSLQLLTTMIDDICHYAGDQSTDVSPGALCGGWFCPSAQQQAQGRAPGRVALEATRLLEEGDASGSTRASSGAAG